MPLVRTSKNSLPSYEAAPAKIETAAPSEIINTPALLGVINVPSAAWENAKPESRRLRNRLLLKWARIERVNKAYGEHFIRSYELTDLGKAVFKE